MTAPALADERLDAVFAALSDPTRRAIVRRLAQGDATVNELAAPFDMSLPGISKHLKVLERSGLISRGRDAQFRPCHLEVTTLDTTIDWIAKQRKALERAVRQARPSPPSDPRPDHHSRTRR